MRNWRYEGYEEKDLNVRNVKDGWWKIVLEESWCEKSEDIMRRWRKNERNEERWIIWLNEEKEWRE